MTLLLGAACDNDPAPDPCEGVTCSDHGTCLVDADNQAYCECDTCYAEDGLTCGREEIEVSADITEPTVWQSHQTITLTDYLYVSSELIIEECVEVRMVYDGAIYVQDDGAIKSEGSEQYPVTFTSSETTPAAGDWRNIEIYPSAAADSRFDYTIFEYGGGYGNGFGTLRLLDGGASVEVTNSTFRNARLHAVQFEPGSQIVGFTGNSFDNIEAELIQIHPEAVASLSPITSTNNSRDVVLIMGGDTLTDGTWNDLGVPYETDGYIYILNTITVASGVTLLMGDDLAIYVQDLGTLLLDGTSDAHVTVTSAQPTPVAGDWRNIEIDDSASTDSLFRFTDFSYGGATGGADSYGMLYVDYIAEIALEDVTFSDAMTCDIYQRGTINATNTTFNLCSP